MSAQGRTQSARILPQEGFQVMYLPIPDFGVPTEEDLEQAVQHTIAYAQAGHHIARIGSLKGIFPPAATARLWLAALATPQHAAETCRCGAQQGVARLSAV